MKKLKICSNAKVNIHLDILNKMENGYHNLFMINQNIDLCDIIYIEKTNNDTTFSSNIKSIDNKKNIIFKAIHSLEKFYKRKFYLKVRLEKKIPIQAGLGGGSSNAAAVIMGIVELYNLDVNINDLIKISSSIGADVPFFLNGGTAVVTGIGDEIFSINNQEFYYIIIKPDFSISTKKAYQDFDNINNVSKSKKLYDISNIYLDKNFIIDNCFNSFDKLYEKKLSLDKIKCDLLDSGAFFSQMSGSGSAIFGIFSSEKEQMEAYEKLRTKYNDIYLSKSDNAGYHIIK